MSAEEKVAIIQAKIISAFAEISAMTAANAECSAIGEFPVFTAEQFRDVPRRFEVEPQSVTAFLAAPES